MDQKVFPFETAVARSDAERRATPLLQRLWPPLMIAMGLVLTLAWIALIGYGLLVLIGVPF
jgi:hypothetical protein